MRRCVRHGDRALAREVLAGERRRASRWTSCGRALGDDLAPVLAGAGAEVDDVVGGADRALVVLDDDHRVAEVAQALERADQLLVVALVQADRGLVEDVEHARPGSSRSASRAGSAAPRRPRAWSRRARATGSRCRRCRGSAGARRSRARRGARSRARSRSARARSIHSSAAPRRELRVLVDVEPADRDREALGPQPGAVARRAGLQRHQLLDPLARVLRVRVLVAALEAVRASRRSAPCRCAGGRSGSCRRPCGARRRCPRAAGRGRACGRSLPRHVDVDPVRPRRPPRAAAGGRSTPPSSRLAARPRRSTASGRGRSAPGRSRAGSRARGSAGSSRAAS